MQSRVWKSSRGARVLAWIVIAAALAALLSLGWILWQGLGQPAVAIILMALAVACIAYMWRFALHPSVRLDDEIVIRNPLRTRRLDANEVVDILPGENGLQIRTENDLVEAWCVQKSTRAIKNQTPTRADAIADEMLTAINGRSDPGAAQDAAGDPDDLTVRVPGGTVAAQDGSAAVSQPTADSTPSHQATPQQAPGQQTTGQQTTGQQAATQQATQQSTAQQARQQTAPGFTTGQSAISASSPQSAPLHHPHLPPGPITPASASYPTSASSASPRTAGGPPRFDARTDSPLRGPAPDDEVEDATIKRADFDTLTLHAVPASQATPISQATPASQTTPISRAIPATGLVPDDAAPATPSSSPTPPRAPTPAAPAHATRALAAATDDDGDFEDEVDGDAADELIIRRARLDDAELLAHLEQQASERPLRHVFGGRPFPVDDIHHRWVDVLGNWRNKVRIAHVGDQPVGYVAYGEGRIHRLGVVEQHTRRGFGGQLLSYATDDVFRSSPTVELDVLADNHSAREFYQAQGWRDTGDRSPSEFPPNPMLMRLVLGRPRH